MTASVGFKGRRYVGSAGGTSLVRAGARKSGRSARHAPRARSMCRPRLGCRPQMGQTAREDRCSRCSHCSRSRGCFRSRPAPKANRRSARTRTASGCRAARAISAWRVSRAARATSTGRRRRASGCGGSTSDMTTIADREKGDAPPPMPKAMPEQQTKYAKVAAGTFRIGTPVPPDGGFHRSTERGSDIKITRPFLIQDHRGHRGRVVLRDEEGPQALQGGVPGLPGDQRVVGGRESRISTSSRGWRSSRPAT